MGSNPAEVLNFFQFNLQSLKLQLSLQRSYMYLHLKNTKRYYSSIHDCSYGILENKKDALNN